MNTDFVAASREERDPAIAGSLQCGESEGSADFKTLDDIPLKRPRNGGAALLSNYGPSIGNKMRLVALPTLVTTCCRPELLV